MLLANGHPSARRYPIATVWYEAQLVQERINHQTNTEVTLMHAAMVAIMAVDGKGTKHFEKLLKELRDGH